MAAARRAAAITVIILEKRFAINVRNSRNIEELVDSRSDVNKMRIRLLRLAIDEQNTLRILVVERAVISTPFFHIVFQQIFRNSSERGLPGNSIAVVKANDKIRRIADVF